MFPAFSILERIDVGETITIAIFHPVVMLPFSILERIDVGETQGGVRRAENFHRLSVSSNGSTWVKRDYLPINLHPYSDFQYPRTDRRG